MATTAGPWRHQRGVVNLLGCTKMAATAAPSCHQRRVVGQIGCTKMAAAAGHPCNQRRVVDRIGCTKVAAADLSFVCNLPRCRFDFNFVRAFFLLLSFFF